MSASVGMRLRTVGEKATQACGAALAALLAPNDVIILTGDLGAGKTQLTKGLAVGLGVAEPVTSPTFNLLLVHQGRLSLYHFDLYRLETAAQLEDLDYWGTLEAEGVSVVEWGDRFAEALPEQGLIVRIHITADEERSLGVEPLGERGMVLTGEWAAACGRLAGVDVSVGGGVR